MISLKKYWDMDVRQGELQATTLEAYRSALLAMGKSGVRACAPVGADLQQNLAALEGKLAGEITPALVKQTEKQVEEQLQQWGGRTAEHLKAKANEVKELLIVLARAADSVGERDQRYTSYFSQFTTGLQSVANLEDLSQIRASLVKGAADLKGYVNQMAQDSQNSVAQLRAEVSTYETKLKAVEELALRDPLTGLSNRRNLEERIEWRISHQQNFCIVMIDLNKFKPVNDTYGHQAGDSLLKKFAEELRSNLRSGDLVGRWGGDEFLVVLDCNFQGAKSHIERMRKWVFGEYTIQTGPGAGEIKVGVDASVGIAEWRPGETLQQVVESADAAMYRDKEVTRKLSPGPDQAKAARA